MTNHRILLGLVPLAITVAVACTDEQRRSLGEEDVRDSLRASVERVLADHGSATDDDGLDCTSTVAADGVVDAACNGQTEDGEAIAGTYRGTADIGVETCTAELVVTIGVTTLPTDPTVDCFAV